MLRECTKSEFEQNIEFAYGLAMDRTRSGYPAYYDGIKTKEMFIRRALKAFERDTEQMLVFERDDSVQGLIHFYWIPEDRYLQTIGFNIAAGTEQALSEFIAYIGHRFREYDAHFGFPAENREAVGFLARQGFACIENDYNNTAFLDRCGEMPENDGLIRIGRENYDVFRVIHSRMDGGMYWNSDRMLDALEEWAIFVSEKGGEPRGAVYYRQCGEGWYEIYGIDIDQEKHDPELFRELLNAALRDAKRRDGRAMTFFCEEEYEKAALECGFECVGNYLCYKTHLE